jgi:hypothetical protein
LFLNPSKCEWSWLDSSNTNPCPLRGEGSDKIALVPTDEIMMLGVPLGSKAFSAEYVQKKLFSRLRQSTSQLMEFEDTQSALYLLRISYGIVRANHFMRTTPLDHWQEQAVKFDSTIRDAAETILGYKFLPDSYVQACLTPKLGGIGIRRAIEHSPLAFSASWFESQKTAAEKWTPRPDMVPYLNSDGDPLTQKQASFVLDTRLHQELVARAPNKRERQRLLRVAQEHAGAFVTALPSDEDGRDTILSPRNFSIAVGYRLGVPLLEADELCSLCKQTLDKYGDHAACCPKSGDVIHRHNFLRNLIARFASEGHLSPQLEKKGILGPTSGRRPGDVTIPIWHDGKGLCVDVAVTSPFTSRGIDLKEPCENYALNEKHKKYDTSFRGQPYDFAAMVFETTGAINSEGVGVLKQIWRFGARQQSRMLCVYIGRAWARLSCNLQRSVSQAILNRSGGGHSSQFQNFNHLLDNECEFPELGLVRITHEQDELKTGSKARTLGALVTDLERVGVRV